MNIGTQHRPCIVDTLCHQDVFGGTRGAVADALNLNAGVALAACSVAKDVAEGVAMAQV